MKEIGAGAEKAAGSNVFYVCGERLLFLSEGCREAFFTGN